MLKPHPNPGAVAARALTLALLTTAALAEDFATGPLIEKYGPVIAVANRDLMLDSERDYHVVFDAAAYPGSPAELNAELETVARFLNMHALNGVSPERMHLAVVVHGDALKSVLADDAYRRRYDSANPSLDLLLELQAAGVAIYVCGQSMGARGVEKSELASPARVALSAMTVLSTLQANGYSLIP